MIGRSRSPARWRCRSWSASLIPFDLGVAMVMLLQGFGAIMLLKQPRKSWGLVVAGIGGGVLAGLGYLALYFLVRGRLPDEDTTSIISSGLIGSVRRRPRRGRDRDAGGAAVRARAR